MRVLATTVPGWGHLVPMLGVLRALLAAGHDVTVATHPELHPTLASLGIPAVPAGLGEAELLAERLRRWPETATRPPSGWAPRMFAEIAAPAMASDLHRMITWTPDLVLSEKGEHGGARFAAGRELPFVSHGWGSPLSSVPAGNRAIAHLDPCPRSLNPSGWTGPPRWPVRLTTPRLTPADPHTMAWVGERKRPLACVSFGTVPMYRDVTPPDELLDALLATGVDALCTDPRHPAAPDDRIRIERFVSLPDVLPACALVVCHGGAGTTLAALVHAVPVVVLPRGAPSQARMAGACAARGVAAVVDDDHPDLRSVIRAVLTGDYARHAADLAREIAAAPDPAQVVETLEHSLGF
ncbi:glycosyltransferase [Amycolatopsis sp. NPDC051128]|uniref:glycosyltransferase n=1 Tax=Amycolatopsis sp. NPDC051128 TaxID=3155412 RepID=UPI00343708EC